jgi:hypothetical protein
VAEDRAARVVVRDFGDVRAGLFAPRARFAELLRAVALAPRPAPRFACAVLRRAGRFFFSPSPSADVERPAGGGGSCTPARRAFESPIAMACFGFFAPCMPSRMCSISSRTNAPACVVGALPSRLSCLARSIVFFSGMTVSFPPPRRSKGTAIDRRVARSSGDFHSDSFAARR